MFITVDLSRTETLRGKKTFHNLFLALSNTLENTVIQLLSSTSLSFPPSLPLVIHAALSPTSPQEDRTRAVESGSHHHMYDSPSQFPLDLYSTLIASASRIVQLLSFFQMKAIHCVRYVVNLVMHPNFVLIGTLDRL